MSVGVCLCLSKQSDGLNKLCVIENGCLWPGQCWYSLCLVFLFQNAGSGDVLENARRWKIKIIHIDREYHGTCT